MPKELVAYSCSNFVFFAPCNQHLDRPGVSFCSRTTYTENAITNAVDIYRNSRYLFTFILILVLDVQG